jgi:Cupin domain
MPHSDTGERVTPVLDFPSRDRLVVQAIRVYVTEGSATFGLDDGEPVVLKAGESFYEPPGALHSVSRDASHEVPASLIAFFVLGEGGCRT